MKDNDIQEVVVNSGFSAEDEKKYIAEYKKTGNKALRDFIIESNINLVHYFIRTCTKCSTNDYDDYFQEGCVALLVSLDKFDLSFNCRFCTYACWWLRQAFQRYRFANFSSIHIPVHICEELSKIYRYGVQDDITGNKTDLTEVLNRDTDHIDYIKSLGDVISLNRVIGSDDSDMELGDLLPDANSTIDLDLEKAEVRNSLHQIFDILGFNNQMRDVIEKRLGFYDGEVWTLQAIAECYGCTRERIRQIETRAIKKMRNSYRVKNLLEGYEEGLHC